MSGARGRVDGDVVQRGGAEQDRTAEIGETRRAVAGVLRCDAQAALARETHRHRDVVGRRSHDDERRMLVGGEVPGLARRIPRGVCRGDDVAREGLAEGLDVDGGRFAHRVNLALRKAVLCQVEATPLGVRS